MGGEDEVAQSPPGKSERQQDRTVLVAIIGLASAVLVALIAAVVPPILDGDDEPDSSKSTAMPMGTSAADSAPATSALTAAESPGGGTEISSTSLLEPGGNERYDVQAEELVLVDPMTVVAEPSAERGRFVETRVSGQGTATWQVQVDQAGEYMMWAQVRIPAWREAPTDTNSFDLTVNGGQPDTWDLFETDAGSRAGAWQWEPVSVRCGGAQERHNCDPYVFLLSAGVNEIVFAGREPFSQLDALVLTNDATLVP